MSPAPALPLKPGGTDYVTNRFRSRNSRHAFAAHNALQGDQHSAAAESDAYGFG
jgi:hypothetical protein